MKYLPTVLIFFLLAGSGAMGQTSESIKIDSLRQRVTILEKQYQFLIRSLCEMRIDSHYKMDTVGRTCDTCEYFIVPTLHFSHPAPPGTVGWYKWHDKDSVTFFGFYHGEVISDYDKPFVSGHL